MVSRLVGGSQKADVLDYLLQGATRSFPKHHQQLLLVTSVRIEPAREEDVVEFRDTWASYLTVPDSTVRAESVLKVGEMVRRLRIYSKGQDNSEDLQARLQRIADEDPDKEARDRAKYALDSIRNAHWREDG
ncbi:MAG: hypothetical protein EDS66_17815 [Planctomycetota bacterium]|nr:MAG: hypothetical protein EDS66_17815 [Planctomycetota bacterium]